MWDPTSCTDLHSKTEISFAPYPETHLISQACPVSPWTGRASWTWGCLAANTQSRHRKSRHGSASAALSHTCGRCCAGRAGWAGGWRAPYRWGRSAPSRCFWSGPGDGDMMIEIFYTGTCTCAFGFFAWQPHVSVTWNKTQRWHRNSIRDQSEISSVFGDKLAALWLSEQQLLGYY